MIDCSHMVTQFTELHIKLLAFMPAIARHNTTAWGMRILRGDFIEDTRLNIFMPE